MKRFSWFLVLILAVFLLLPTILFAETDVTDKIEITKSRLLYDRRTGNSSLNVSLRNISDDVLLTPIKLVINDISDPTVHVSSPDGYTHDNGLPYFLYESQDYNLIRSETTDPKKIIFSNPNRRRFTYNLTVLASGFARGSVEISQNTKIIDSDSLSAHLNEVAEDFSYLVFHKNVQVNMSLTPGDVIVLGLSEFTPKGALRKIVEIHPVGDYLVIETIQASLTDAIDNCDMQIRQTLTPGRVNAVDLADGVVFTHNSPFTFTFNETVGQSQVLYDVDGDYNTVDDQVRADGSITFEIDFLLDLKISDEEVERFVFTTTASDDTELNISVGGALSFDNEIPIATNFDFGTHIFVLGGVLPVFYTPQLGVVVGATVEAKARMTTGATHVASLTGGFLYENENWSLISETPENDFQFIDPELTLGGIIRGYIGPRLGIEFYGVLTPYVDLEPYLELQSEFANELCWGLYGGLELDAGIISDIFDIKYEKDGLIDISDLIAGSECVSMSDKIAIINPDHHRILKHGIKKYWNTTATGKYYSIAYGEALDIRGVDELANPGSWVGVGNQSDFIGTILEDAGYEVDYYEAEDMPVINTSDYGIVIVQDPLRTNIMQFDAQQAEQIEPDLLEYVLGSAFLTRLDNYINSGGKVVLVGDAVKLLETRYGKSVSIHNATRNAQVESPLIPDRWLFVRGNPFCGRDRAGSATSTITSSSIAANGSNFATLLLRNLNDIPTAETWSETIYYPSDGTSLLDLHFVGSGRYVLSGSVCSPPQYTVSVDETIPHMIGYTSHNGNRIYYIGSDSFFDFHFRNHDGAWHARQYSEISYVTSDEAKDAVVNLVEFAKD